MLLSNLKLLVRLRLLGSEVRLRLIGGIYGQLRSSHRSISSGGFRQVFGGAFTQLSARPVPPYELSTKYIVLDSTLEVFGLRKGKRKETYM